MDVTPVYLLTLHKTYYEQGFFNLGVEIERFVRSDNGPVTLVLGNSGSTLTAHVNRDANENGTPRVMGGAELRNWFSGLYKQDDTVQVKILSKDRFQLG